MVDGDKAPVYGETLEVSRSSLLFFVLPFHRRSKFLAAVFEYAFSYITRCHDFQELGRYKAQTKLPFNAFGTMAMAREVRLMQIKHISICIYLNIEHTLI
jgi:hypothetical protein